MSGLLRNFDLALRLAVVVAVVATAVAAVVWRRAPLPSRVPATARVLAVGAVLTAVVATVVTPGGMAWGYHQLAMAPGSGGLGDLAVLRDPTSLPALQLVLNVVLYVPIGLTVTVARGADSAAAWTALAVGAATTVGVEALQWQFTTRLASTDDVLLNLIGTGVGAGVALLGGRWFATIKAA